MYKDLILYLLLVYVCVQAARCTCGSRGTILGSQFSASTTWKEIGDKAQAFRLSGKHLSPLSHLGSPHILTLICFHIALL